MSYSELCALTNVLVDFSKETGSNNFMGSIDINMKLNNLSKYTRLVFYACFLFLFQTK